jgi:hypothetical protein
MIDTFEKIWRAIDGDGKSSASEITGALEAEITKRGALMSKFFNDLKLDELVNTGRERKAFIQAYTGFNGHETAEKSDIWRGARAKREEMELEGTKLKDKEREEKSEAASDMTEAYHGEASGDNTLRFQASQERAEARRAGEILDGAALIPDGLDSNLPNADLNFEQEAVKSSIGRANAEVAEMRSSAVSKEDAASRNTAEATASARGKMGPGVIVTAAQKGRTYTGKIIGMTGSGPDTLAIQRISGNQAVLHKIKDIASESSIAVGADVSITKGRDGKISVKTREEISKEKERKEYDSMERGR